MGATGEPQEIAVENHGWDAFFADAFEPYAGDNLIPARVSARHPGLLKDVRLRSEARKERAWWARSRRKTIY